MVVATEIAALVMRRFVVVVRRAKGTRGIVTRGWLLLVLRLVTTVDLALVETALDPKGKSIWDLNWEWRV